MLASLGCLAQQPTEVRRTQREPTELRDDRGKPIDVTWIFLVSGPALVLDVHERRASSSGNCIITKAQHRFADEQVEFRRVFADETLLSLTPQHDLMLNASDVICG